ncbi:MAG: hypothetical protein ACM4AI_12195, partial [Acidobacteriota bacterium]
YREWVLPRMIQKGVIPMGTKLTPFNPMPEDAANPADHVRPGESLNAEERKLFACMAEPVNVRGRSYKILADVEIKDADCAGVIFAHGSRFGGHALFLKNQKLHYVYNFLGIKPEQKFISPEPLKPGKYTLGMEFTRDKAGPHGESLGKTTLYVNDKAVAQGEMRTQAGKFTLSGDGLCIGRDSGDAVSEDYRSPGTFHGGKILFVGVTVEKTQYLDLEKLAAAALAAD